MTQEVIVQRFFFCLSVSNKLYVFKNIKLNEKLDRKTYFPNNPLSDNFTCSSFQLPKAIELLVCMVAFPEVYF